MTQSLKHHFDRLFDALNQVILGKPTQVRLAMTCLLSNGHLLIEDLPGMGKTTLAHALASGFGLSYKRVQFTADLLPSDIIGVSLFDKGSGEFRFQKGPVFTQVLLADEINRATPKCQSALLEAMEEHQVTVEGVRYPLPEPFFVIATQNPSFQTGTFPLPESQLDRFLMRISLGYPDSVQEKALLAGKNRRELIEEMPACLSLDELQRAQEQVSGIHVSDSLLDYIVRLVAFSREESSFSVGLSPRAAQALVQAARAWAFLNHRDHVVPEDVQQVLPSVAEHRLRGSVETLDSHKGEVLARKLLDAVPVIQ